jgi:soluble lytic murein transglycosylase-like protein
MITPEIRTKILFWSKASNIDPNLIAAIVETESAGNPFAMRYEKHWRYILRPVDFAMKLNITPETERTLQMFSYGLMQIMGSVAREYGMQGELPKLLDPDLGIQYGTIHLRGFISRYKSIPDAVSSYNQGSPVKNKNGVGYKNQAYVDKVMSLYEKKLISIGP